MLWTSKNSIVAPIDLYYPMLENIEFLILCEMFQGMHFIVVVYKKETQL